MCTSSSEVGWRNRLIIIHRTRFQVQRVKIVRRWRPNVLLHFLTPILQLILLIFQRRTTSTIAIAIRQHTTLPTRGRLQPLFFLLRFRIGRRDIGEGWVMRLFNRRPRTTPPPFPIRQLRGRTIHRAQTSTRDHRGRRGRWTRSRRTRHASDARCAGTACWSSRSTSEPH